MKNYLLIFFISLTFISCENLEIVPSDRLSDAAIWTSPITANLFLNDIYYSLNAGPYVNTYLNLPSELSNDPLDNFTDNTTYGPDAGPASKVYQNNDSYSPTSALFLNQWKNMYANIRKCNLFMSKVSASTFPAATKKSMNAQARFLRAYFYKQLVDLHGGVPIITKVLINNPGDTILYPRKTYAECVAFIRAETTLAADSLPVSWTGKDIGRATRGAALAMRGEEELYAGKWAEAAATNQTIMNELATNGYGLFTSYAGLFYQNNENNKEVIFDIQYAPILRYRNIDQYWGVPMVAKGAGWGAVDPTQNLVDAYEFTDGKTEAEGSTLFDPTKPYKNRDKRFYASIIYDGSIWRGTVIYTRLGIANNVNEINVTGKTGNAGRTGYFTKKQLDSTIFSTAVTGAGLNFIVFRYAEVLLNYAEAKNEVLTTPDASIYTAINQLRTRGGLPALPANLTQNEMRQKIRHERRIELAFEGKYFYDIMRWRTAEQIFSQPVQGMKITSAGGVLTYTKIPVRTVLFNPLRGYLQPIPQYAMDQNSLLVQNPGYN